MQSEPQRRERLFDLVRQFRTGATQLGIPLQSQSTLTPIQPVILASEKRTLEVSRRLFERGFWVAAIRPPTVPAGTARLRITLSAAHTPQQIAALLDALAVALQT